MLATDSTLDAVLCRVLVDRRLPRELTTDEVDALWRRARYHDVDVLIAADLLRLDRSDRSTARDIAARLAEAELFDLLRSRELSRITARFAAERVDLLLLKGAGLAHTVYPAPHLRPSRDIDLFVRRTARDASERALEACGYARMREPDGELARTQRNYSRVDASGAQHFVDLHWGASNAVLFADALSFDRAWSSSIVVPLTDPPARTLGPVDAMLLACVHRVAHHDDAADLLWLWDIHLLAGRLAAAEWPEFVEQAKSSGMCAVSARGLRLARDRFASAVPDDVLERLARSERAEPAGRFIGGDLRKIDAIRVELASVSSWRKRFTLLREHLFPHPSYMRALYTRCPAMLLPLAYVDRIVRGAPKWFRRPQSLP